MRVVHPNIGAERGLRAPSWPPASVAIARRFVRMFGAGTEVESDVPMPSPAGTPAQLVQGLEGYIAWLGTEDARTRAERRGLALAGSPPEVVRACHDKAFAVRAARDLGLGPSWLHDRIEVHDSGGLADAPRFLAHLEAYGARLPAFVRGRFTLKPRLSTSATGRVAAVHGDLPAAIRGALPRLARSGGVVVEPWLTRRTDLAAVLRVGGSETRLLGSLRVECKATGQLVAHHASIDADGRIRAGTPWDHPFEAAALRLGEQARRLGFRGIGGVDGFTFFGPDGAEVLRPVCEFNARFTAGTCTLAELQRGAYRGPVSVDLWGDVMSPP